LQLAGHPVRWRLLRELARTDRQVRELTSLTGHPQSLVSYHLGRLRAAQLVSARRSSADGRDAYYTVDLARCGELLAAAGGALHPALGPGQPQAPAPRAPARVLFLCTGNGARSQMAEALAQQRSDGLVQAFSAGSHPRSLHPNTVRVMTEHGIDVRGRAAKHLSVFAADRFGYVITLCDRVREVCPEFPAIPGTSTGASPTRPRPVTPTRRATRPSRPPRPSSKPGSASCSPRSPPRRPVQPTRRRDDQPARDGERPLHGR
jgi:DNA-binding transcriptional ArsR family regulator